MVRERSDTVPSEPEALRPWRSGACGARRPAQTAPNRGKAPAPGRRTLGAAREPVFDGRHAGRGLPRRAVSGCGRNALPGWLWRSASMAPMAHDDGRYRRMHGGWSGT